jgi:pyrimidine operon attenuation protein/uracil phosphoribosyltransferase
MSDEVMAAREVERTIARMAHEIVEKAGDPRGFALVGVITGGLPLAERLADHIAEAEGHRPEVGHVDITLYRDDLYTGLEKPELGETRLPQPLSRRGLVIVDDVLFTGRTVRAALGEIMDYGRPTWIKLAVLVDRGHRELPIAADVVGREVVTRREDKVVVHLSPDRTGVEIRRPEEPA